MKGIQQPAPSLGFSPRPDSGYGSGYGPGLVRYTAPVTPPSMGHGVGGGSGLIQPSNPSYLHQSSTPLPNTTYQPPVTPSTSHFRSSQKKEYSGPQKVITPQPVSNEGYTPSFTPRKDSWSSSRSSLSSEPPSPLRLQSEELSTEIDRKKEIKGSLIDEVAQLTKQKDSLLAELDEHKLELRDLEETRKEVETSLDALTVRSVICILTITCLILEN